MEQYAGRKFAQKLAYFGGHYKGAPGGLEFPLAVEHDHLLAGGCKFPSSMKARSGGADDDNVVFHSK